MSFSNSSLPAKNSTCQNHAYQRAARLARLFNMMEQNPPFQNAHRIVLSMPVLFQGCISYEIDMERWMQFHSISVPDKHKRAALIFKWLAKSQPIKLLTTYSVQATPFELGSNAYFAILGALGELDVNMNTFAVSPEAKAIYYSAMYRDISAESWAITFCLLEKAYPA